MEFTKEDIEKAIAVIFTTIANCEKAQMKFSEGTSQHSLLKNRVKALNISKSLLSESATIRYTNKDLREALPPITSIISKTTKAQSKYDKGSSRFNHFKPLIQAMLISKAYIEKELGDDSM